MARSLHWKDLKIGMLSTAGVILAAAGVLIFGRVGTLHGKTFDLYVTTKAARGVIRGTEVWLEGQKVGLVRDVAFQPPNASADDRLVMKLRVLESAQRHIRLDSRVQIRAGASLIGDQVVYINSGTARTRQVADGDTIRSTHEQSDFEAMSAEAAGAAKEFPAIIENVKLLTAQMQSVNSTLGAFATEGTDDAVSRVRARASNLLARLSSSDGTFSLAMTNHDFATASAKRAMAQADSIRALLASNEHSLGRFRRDSSIVREITKVRAALDSLQHLADTPNGTIGRLRSDSTIIRNIHRARASLDSLIADMKKHPLRYSPF